MFIYFSNFKNRQSTVELEARILNNAIIIEEQKRDENSAEFKMLKGEPCVGDKMSCACQ